MKRLILVFLTLTGVTLAVAQEEMAFRDGESFQFRVSWGIFGNAGDVRVTAKDEVVEGLPRLRILTFSGTRGVIRTFYPFDGQVDSLFDISTGRLLTARATTSAGKKQTKAMIMFDYDEAEANYVDYVRPERSATVSVPVGQPMDMITSLIQTRAWQLKPGQSRDVVVLFDREFYPLTITAEKVETIPTPNGKRQATLLVPRMKGEPKGMFRRGGEVRVWISDDAQFLPLRFEVKLQVGTATAVLTDYDPPVKDAK